MSKYEIKSRLTEEELHTKIHELNKEYAGKVFQHRNGSIYEVYGSTVINKDNSAWWGLLYRPINKEGKVDYHILHSRTLDEFLDGRFGLIIKPTSNDISKHINNYGI